MPTHTVQKQPTAAEIRARLDARTQAIGDRLASIKHELTTVQDVTVAGRPLLDHVRRRPLEAAGLTLAAGLVVGLLAGFRARSRRRPPADERTEVLRLYVAQLLDAAAQRAVARGEEAEEAIERVLAKKPPLIYYAPPEARRRSTFAETFDVAVKSAMGFGVKVALDRLAQRITQEDELFAALDRVEKDPSV